MPDHRPLRPAAPSAAILTCLAMVGLLAFPDAVDAAPEDRLVGKWQAEAMEVDGKRYPVKPPMNIVFEFARGGKFVATITFKENVQRKEGTWSVAGTVLTMTAADETQKMIYSIAGTQLRMERTLAGKKTIHHMKRLP